jgi:hypothetical protein
MFEAIQDIRNLADRDVATVVFSCTRYLSSSVCKPSTLHISGTFQVVERLGTKDFLFLFASLQVVGEVDLGS